MTRYIGSRDTRCIGCSCSSTCAPGWTKEKRDCTIATPFVLSFHQKGQSKREGITEQNSIIVVRLGRLRWLQSSKRFAPTAQGARSILRGAIAAVVLPVGLHHSARLHRGALAGVLH